MKKESKRPTPKRGVEGLSNWHFATLQTSGAEYNSVIVVNQVGTAYATNPNQADAQKLLQAFHGYLMKYVRLLTSGKLDNAIPKDTQQFLSLFIPSGNYSYGQRLAEFRKVAERLPNMAIQSLMTSDDIYNELAIIFLDLAKKFKPEIGGFTGYIQYHFKYAVKTRLFQVQNDPINYQPLYEDQPDSDESYHDFGFDVAFYGDHIQIYNGSTLAWNEEDGTGAFVEQYIDIPILNYSFISEPPKPFDKLWNKQQRAVIIKLYLEDKSLSAAAEELGYNNTSIVRKLRDDAIQSYREFIKCDTV